MRPQRLNDYVARLLGLPRLVQSTVISLDTWATNLEDEAHRREQHFEAFPDEAHAFENAVEARAIADQGCEVVNLAAVAALEEEAAAAIAQDAAAALAEQPAHIQRRNLHFHRIAASSPYPAVRRRVPQQDAPPMADEVQAALAGLVPLPRRGN